ncbi:MAG: fibrobacter succinogenes major paralogous domain-containing protein [Bacteroidales bacterium]|nr:fibrobacter succinogenes major paralogous domain-containing protein [Bacteroidales bacterium]
MSAFAQVAINKDGSAPDTSAILQVKGDNNGAPVEAMFIKSATGNVGIGTTTPGFPLTFKDVLGDKISLHGQSGDHWGFGIQYHLLQIHGKNSTSNIVLGYKTISGFTELMRIKGNGQVSIGTSAPEATALFELKSTDKGFLPPRMTTTQMDAIPSPAEGLTVYNTDKNGLCYYNGSNWNCLDKASLLDALFICGHRYSDPETGYTFETVKIGNQCWMAENLNTGTRISTGNNQKDNGIVEKYCYNNEEDSCTIYGGLYQWDEMMQYVTTESTRGICPGGWHIPSDAEWKTLEMNLGMTQQQADTTGWRGTDEGGKLKETGTDHWLSPNTGATNLSGFTALPAGNRYVAGNCEDIGKYNYLRSSTLDTEWPYLPIIRDFAYNAEKIARYSPSGFLGYSVRCVKD